jgi:hypothetical protein
MVSGEQDSFLNYRQTADCGICVWPFRGILGSYLSDQALVLLKIGKII